MPIKDEIWILNDNRPGNLSQTIGLAEEIGFDYRIINIEYSCFCALPNCFFSQSLWRLSSKSRKIIKNINYSPKYIISAGRRSAPIALNLKNKSQNLSKIIQIMNPNLNFDKFDFIILPKHDKITTSSTNHNILTSIGALSKVNDKKINAEKEKFSSWFNNITQPKIALLLGGSSKNTNFTADSAKKLAKISSQITNNMQAKLLVINSRRTGDKITNIFKKNLKCDFKLFDWQEVKDENPYLAILGYANYFIISGDSVSMISECCSTGKQVYIFDEKQISSKKHRKFHHNLYDANYAKNLAHNSQTLDNFSPKKLQETQRIANLIRNHNF